MKCGPSDGLIWSESDQRRGRGGWTRSRAQKSGRVPYIEILYHLQVQGKKPWRQFQRTNCVKIHANENSSAIPRPSTLPKENKIKLNVGHLCQRVRLRRWTREAKTTYLALLCCKVSSMYCITRHSLPVVFMHG